MKVLKYLKGLALCMLMSGVMSANVSTTSVKYKQIIDNKQGKSLAFENFIENLLNYDIIIIGEYHNLDSHKLAEFDIIHALKAHKKLSIVYEMLPSSKQKQINGAIAKKDSIAKNELAQALFWIDDWEYAGSGYERLLEALFYAGDSLIGGNLTYEEKSLIAEKMPTLKGKNSTNPAVQNTLKQIIGGFHAKKWDSIFVNIQQHIDRNLAQKMLENPNPVAIMGAYHASKSIGVPLHIKDLDSTKKVAVVILDGGDNFGLSDADFSIYF